MKTMLPILVTSIWIAFSAHAQPMTEAEYCADDASTVAAQIGQGLSGAWTMTYVSGYLFMNGEYNELPDVADPAQVSFAWSGESYNMTGDAFDGSAQLKLRTDDEIYDLPNDVEFAADQQDMGELSSLAGCSGFLPILYGKSDGGDRSADIYLAVAGSESMLGQVVSIQAEGAVMFKVSLERN